MSETTEPTPPANPGIDALVEVLDRTVASADIQNLLFQRLVTSGDVIPSRIPAPLNITEIGGYLNLLESLGETETRSQMIASVLGVSGPLPAAGLPAGPVLFFSAITNHRPDGPAQPSIPTEIKARSDLIAGLTAALATIADKGCSVPLLGAPAGLPPVGSTIDDDGVLTAIGRQIRVVPAAALVDPDTDPVAVARPDAGGDLRVVARQLDIGAPNAGDVVAANWVAFTCDAAACTESTAQRTFLDVEPILATAGWHHPTPTAPVTIGDQGRWDRFTNITGLVAGETSLGEELRQLYTDTQIAASAVRDRLTHVWDGEKFTSTA